MKFCTNCGNELNENAVVCIKCGAAVNGKSVVENDKWGTGAYVGMIIGSIFIPLIGIAAGIYGLTKDAKRTQGGVLLGVGLFMTLVWLVAQ